MRGPAGYRRTLSLYERRRPGPVVVLRRKHWMRSRTALAAIVVTLLLLSSAGSRTSAQPLPHWTPIGWGGGGFYYAAAFHPSRDGVIYLAGDVNGCYKSED